MDHRILPVKSSASNGVMERGIQSAQGRIRVPRDALEGRLKREIAAVECIVPWIVEWSAHVLNRFGVGKDGRTPFERCKGKRAKHLGIEFGRQFCGVRNPQVEPWGSYRWLGPMVFSRGEGP